MSMFIALLFLPLTRWFNRRGVPKAVSIVTVIVIIGASLKIGGELIQLSAKQILSADNAFLAKAEIKIVGLIENIEQFFGLKRTKGINVFTHYFKRESMMTNVTMAVDIIRSTVSMTLMTTFFVVLLLGESINFQKILNSTILKHEISSIKAFIKIEKDLIKFMKVKFIISLLTGIGTGIACVSFGVSFPIFWGLFAFAINFVQMIGSIITVVLLSLFAFIEFDPSLMLLFFILSITGVQVLFGAILEPVFMGKSFSINVITILVMLSLWGFIWGIPGMIMSIPITVFFKIIFDHFKSTKIISELLSGN